MTAAINGKLSHAQFGNAGIAVSEPPPAICAPFGANNRSKSFFESTIAASWQKTAQGIFDTGNWLEQARDELDRDVYNALRLPFCVRTRNRLIAIATHPILGTHVSQLPPCWGTLHALTEIDDHDLLRAAFADGRIHPGLQRKDIRTTILGLPPRPPKAPKTIDPIAAWAAFSLTDKHAILDAEGRAGLAKLLSPELMSDLAKHSIGTLGESVDSKPAIVLTAILRNALSIEDSGIFNPMKAKLKKLDLAINDVSVALPGGKEGKRGRR
jgi:hypothetical protein